MIISRTPFRISFFGGGTDYPAWYRQEGGAVLSTTIDKYCYISARYLPPFFNIRHRIVWSHIETLNSVNEILHPAIKAGLPYMGFDDSRGLEIHHQGDLPARSGMGSSSSFAVGLIKALTAVRGGMISKKDLALKALELEQVVMKQAVGSQDQIAAAYGGLNVIRFHKQGDFSVEPVSIAPAKIEELQSRLLMIYTGSNRMSDPIARDIVQNVEKKKEQLRKMEKLIEQALHAIGPNGDIDDFGHLLHETWMLKRELSSMISNGQIDKIYETARHHGALGGKLLGAGSSGFMVFYVPPEKRAGVSDALRDFLQVPVRFEREGSTIIYYNPNG